MSVYHTSLFLECEEYDVPLRRELGVSRIPSVTLIGDCDSPIYRRLISVTPGFGDPRMRLPLDEHTNKSPRSTGASKYRGLWTGKRRHQ